MRENCSIGTTKVGFQKGNSVLQGVAVVALHDPKFELRAIFETALACQPGGRDGVGSTKKESTILVTLSL